MKNSKNPSLPTELPKSMHGWSAIDKEIEKVEHVFRNAALAAFTLWGALHVAIFRFAPMQSYEDPEGLERSTHMMSCLLLIVTNGSKILPLFVRDFNFNFAKNGFLFATLAVQAMAITSNFLMFYFPTPVVVDEISGLRFHLVRWAEWTSVAFLMTFLTCNVDSSPQRGFNFVYPTLLAVSTVFGMIFPFCPDSETWSLAMLSSWTLFMAIYVMVYEKSKKYFALKKTSDSCSWNSSAPTEDIGLAKASFSLSVVCSVTWTCLALSFTFVAYFSRVAHPGSWLKASSVPVLITSFFEIASKVWYLNVLIDTYDKVFNDNARAARRLEDLRHFMTAIWSASSDAIVFCIEDGECINARVSPAFLKLLGHSTSGPTFLCRGEVSLMLEIDPRRNICHTYAMDLSKPVSRQDASLFKQNMSTQKYDLNEIEGLSLDDRNIVYMAQLVVESRRSKKTSSLTKSFAKKEGGTEKDITCEATLAELQDGSGVLVLRDITDRLCRFEAEKKLLQEVTSRKKDAEANSFTRHEVKNGILAAIGLLDHIKDIAQRKNPTNHVPVLFVAGESELTSHSQGNPGEVTSQDNDFEDAVTELNSTLHDMLDTILDEAMAREIIYGEYKPKRDRLVVPEVLDSIRRRTSDRFPLRVAPDPFPVLAMDRQLLRYIYRNALSNSCKYGQRDGLVESFVDYDRDEQTLTMKVVNLPGEGHEELINLTPDEVASVFEPGTRLRPAKIAKGTHAQLIQKESSGNGAWIMSKCAEAMGGLCSIRFEPDSTIFSFSCRIAVTPSASDDHFQIPENTWGVAIDDSRIQRKLLDRYLGHAGISKSRRVILGENDEDCFSFGSTVKKLLSDFPDDKILLIADENLDIADGGVRHQSVSGSLSVQKLLSELNSDEDSRLLALIRSANDSAEDRQSYEGRSHGCLLKEPFKKDSVLRTLAPFWQKRFSGTHANNYLVDMSDCDVDIQASSAEDIVEALGVIHALASVDSEAILQKRWYVIREKLHALKGDLMTTLPKKKLVSILRDIDSLLSSARFPHCFSEKLSRVKTELESLLI